MTRMPNLDQKQGNFGSFFYFALRTKMKELNEEVVKKEKIKEKHQEK